MKEFYDEYWEKDKVCSGSYYLDWKRGILLNYFLEDENLFFLDIGCGDGYMLAPFRKTNNVFGVDVSNVAVKQAQKLGINAKVCDLNSENLPFDEKFDAIFCLDVLEHIFDPQNVVKSIFNTLSENGRFAVCVPNVLNLANRIRFLLGDFVDYMDSSHKDKTELFSEHIRLFSKNKLEKILIDAGFKIEKRIFYFPKKMQDWSKFQILGVLLRLFKLHKIFPTLFSLGFFYVCSKENAELKN